MAGHQRHNYRIDLAIVASLLAAAPPRQDGASGIIGPQHTCGRRVLSLRMKGPVCF